MSELAGRGRRRTRETIGVNRVQWVELGTEIEVKRFYLPGVKITSTCPDCGSPVTRDLARDYLSYPTIGENTMGMYHYHEDTDTDVVWDVKVVLHVSVRVLNKEESA